MNDKKQIEEMVRVYCDYCQNQIGERDCEYKLSKQCSVFDECEIFFNAGYRNCKDKVVLTREEEKGLRRELKITQTQRNELSERNIQLLNKVDQACKETAREILQWLKEHCDFVGFGIVETYFREQYGVEIEK